MAQAACCPKDSPTSSIEYDEKHSDGSTTQEDNVIKVNLNKNLSFDRRTASTNSISYLSIDNSLIDKQDYEPVKAHWFYCDTPISGSNKKNSNQNNPSLNWQPFSIIDSNKIESCWLQKCQVTDLNLQETQKTNDKNKKSNVSSKKNKTDRSFIVTTDGGLYDVDLKLLHRAPVYWRGETFSVRRCTWFYKKEGHIKFEPYDAQMCEKLEGYFKACSITKDWFKRYHLGPAELLVINGPNLFIHYDDCRNEEWLNMAENPYSPRQVHRGVQGIFNLEAGEYLENTDEVADHLVFFVHGVGGVCDVRFRSCIEVVSDFRKTANNLLAEHSKNHSIIPKSNTDESIKETASHTSETSSTTNSKSGEQSNETFKPRRIAFLPISWHGKTRRQTGLNDCFNAVALKSVPKLRHFLNKIIIDALLYSAGPTYSQIILNNVANEINRLYTLFIERHPKFKGSVSLAGHSLGSVILFDLLANQIPNNDVEKSEKHISKCTTVDEVLKNLDLTEYAYIFHKEKIDMNSLILLTDADFKELKLPLGPRRRLEKYINFNGVSQMNLLDNNDANISSPNSNNSTTSTTPNNNDSGYSSKKAFNTGQWLIKYPQLKFKPRCFFAFGSPLTMFLTVRGIHHIPSDYKLPTCDKMLNIFHPYDPLAYRVEPMIDINFKQIDPILTPHHKGGKRIHLQLREGIVKVGHDIKHKIWDSIRSTWSSFTRFSSTAARSSSSSTSSKSSRRENQSLEPSPKNSPVLKFKRSNSATDASITVINAYPMDKESMSNSGSKSKQALTSGRKRKQFVKSFSDINVSSLESIIENVDAISDNEESPTTMSPSMDQRTRDEVDVAMQEVSEASSNRKCSDATSTGQDVNDEFFEDLSDLAKKSIGNLNGGNRIDYVMQEKPIEYVFNEYVFAFASHASYWQNEDSAMMMLNEIYQVDKVQLFDYFN